MHCIVGSFWTNRMLLAEEPMQRFSSGSRADKKGCIVITVWKSHHCVSEFMVSCENCTHGVYLAEWKKKRKKNPTDLPGSAIHIKLNHTEWFGPVTDSFTSFHGPCRETTAPINLTSKNVQKCTPPPTLLGRTPPTHPYTQIPLRPAP